MKDFVTEWKKIDKLAQEKEEVRKKPITPPASVLEPLELYISPFVAEKCESWEDMEKLLTDIRDTFVHETLRRVLFMVAFLADKVKRLEKEKKKNERIR